MMTWILSKIWPKFNFDMTRTVGIFGKPGHRVKLFCGFFEIKIQEEAWSTKIKYIMKKSNQCRWNKFGQKMFKSCWFPTPERKKLFLKMICYLNYTEIFITWFYYSNLKIMFYLKDIPVGRLFKKLWVRNHRLISYLMRTVSIDKRSIVNDCAHKIFLLKLMTKTLLRIWN